MKKEIPALKMQDVGGAELPYLYYEGGAKNILFAHATGFLPWLWHPIIQELVPEYSVWAPYIYNYRSCDPAKGGLSWNVIAGDLATFCRAQQIEKPLLIGHSMGSTVLTIAAAAYGIDPCGMILIEPIFLPEEFYALEPKVEDHPLASKSLKRLNHWQSEEQALDYLKSKSLFSGWDDQVLQLYLQYGMEKQQTGDLRLTCTPESEAAMFIGGWSRNPWPLLDKIACPTLVIEGLESANVGLVDVKRAVSMLRKGKYQPVAKAGHLIPMQKPQEVTMIIKEFLAGLT